VQRLRLVEGGLFGLLACATLASSLLWPAALLASRILLALVLLAILGLRRDRSRLRAAVALALVLALAWPVGLVVHQPGLQWQEILLLAASPWYLRASLQRGTAVSGIQKRLIFAAILLSFLTGMLLAAGWRDHAAAPWAALLIGGELVCGVLLVQPLAAALAARNEPGVFLLASGHVMLLCALLLTFVAHARSSYESLLELLAYIATAAGLLWKADNASAGRLHVALVAMLLQLPMALGLLSLIHNPHGALWAYLLLAGTIPIFLITQTHDALLKQTQRAEQKMSAWMHLLSKLNNHTAESRPSLHAALWEIFQSLTRLEPEIMGCTLYVADQNLVFGTETPHMLKLSEGTTRLGCLYCARPQTLDSIRPILPLLTMRFSHMMREWRARQEAMTDPLTNLLNRRGWQSESAAAILRAAEHGRPISVLSLDIDHFKMINDRFGHEVGDRALQGVASAIRREARQDDVAARMGGEEFAILCWHTDLAQAQRIAERLRLAIKMQQIPPIDTPITVSIGLAGGQVPLAEQVLQEWLQQADSAMYAAKKAGRDRVVVHGAPEQQQADPTSLPSPVARKT
jgi:diguanylate cyclase (GGDEF)-like protein